MSGAMSLNCIKYINNTFHLEWFTIRKCLKLIIHGQNFKIGTNKRKFFVGFYPIVSILLGTTILKGCTYTPVYTQWVI